MDILRFKRRLSGAVLEILRLDRVGFDGGLGHDVPHVLGPRGVGQPDCEPIRSVPQTRISLRE